MIYGSDSDDTSKSRKTTTDPKPTTCLFSNTSVEEVQHASQTGDRLLSTVPSQTGAEVPATSSFTGSVKAQHQVIFFRLHPVRFRHSSIGQFRWSQSHKPCWTWYPVEWSGLLFWEGTDGPRFCLVFLCFNRDVMLNISNPGYHGLSKTAKWNEGLYRLEVIFVRPGNSA